MPRVGQSLRMSSPYESPGGRLPQAPPLAPSSTVDPLDVELAEIDVPHEGVLEPLELPFDQHERYRLVADLCRGFARAGETLSVLDVGGRTGILRRFLPEARVELVDLEPAASEGLVLGTGSRLPFADGALDLVVAVDTLEHVPPGEREAFVRECCRVARRGAVLAGPYAHPDVDEAEEILSAFLHDKLGLEHRYLAEHRALGLPVRGEVEAWCRAAGARAVVALGRGNLDRWLGLVTLSMVIDQRARLRPIARRLYRFLNRASLDSDPRGIVYRHGVVALFDDTPPPTADSCAPPPARDVDPELLPALSHLGRELLAFDQQRDVFDAECARLQRVIQAAGRDLEGHREVLRRLGEDLTQHRAVLAEREAELEQTSKVVTALASDLEEHRRTLAAERADREDERAAQARTVAELRAQIATHEEHARELGRAIDGVRAEARAIEAELLRKTRWRRKIRSWLRRR